jgi:isopenicillin N synthase-like dioxygenase
MTGSFDNIPVIDVAPLAAGGAEGVRRIAREMRVASESAGFFYVRNHGISTASREAALAAARAFFALPEAEKRRVSVNALHRGYVPMGQTTLSEDARADMKESFVWGLELAADDADVRAGKALMGPNRWPAAMPGMAGALYGYFEEAMACGHRLLRGLAVALDLPEGYFAARFAKPLARGAIIHYPPQPPAEPDDQFGTSAHTDYGGLTLLWQDANGGLEVLNRDGVWVAATPIPDTLVINVGDLLSRWTNDVFASNAHRVVNRSGRERYSMPVFFDPDYDTEIATLESCIDDHRPAQYPATTCGAYIVKRFDSVFEYRK